MLIFCLFSFLFFNTFIPVESQLELLGDSLGLLGNMFGDGFSLITNMFGKRIDPETTMSVTKDGYILTVHRIPYGKKGKGKQPRKPVILEHGFLLSSAIWILNTPDKNLAYLLADDGYDVWLGNIRGSSYGSNHSTVSIQNPAFWDYSFDQMAQYDIPATIQKMIEVTGFKQVYYIGHSMGTTILFALLSSQPEYNNIIKTGFLMAPVISAFYAQGDFKRLKKHMPILEVVTSFFETVFGGRIGLKKNKRLFLAKASTNPIYTSLVDVIVSHLAGNGQHTNITRLPLYLQHVPDFVSSQLISHYSQLQNAENFSRFDYGEAGNLQHYQSVYPPTYDVSKITAPLAIYWSKNDICAFPGDVAVLLKKLKNNPFVYEIKEPFNHMDFVWGNNINALIYDKLLYDMRRFWH